MKKVDDCSYVGWSEDQKNLEKKDDIVDVFNGWDSDFGDIPENTFNSRDDIDDRANRQPEYSLGVDVELDTDNDEKRDDDIHVDIHEDEDEDDDIDSEPEYDFKLQSENENAVHHRLGDDDTAEEVPTMMATDVDTAEDVEDREDSGTNAVTNQGSILIPEQANNEEGAEVQTSILDLSCTILDDASTLDDVSSSEVKVQPDPHLMHTQILFSIQDLIVIQKYLVLFLIPQLHFCLRVNYVTSYHLEAASHRLSSWRIRRNVNNFQLATYTCCCHSRFTSTIHPTLSIMMVISIRIVTSTIPTAIHQTI